MEKERKEFLVGSTYFFKDYKNFKSKDIDILYLIDNPYGFNISREISISGRCEFEWKRVSPEEFVERHLKTRPIKSIKFLNKEFCKEIGFTIEHLKKLKEKFENMDEKHKYTKIIYDAYIQNNDFILTDEQRLSAFNEYLRTRGGNYGRN